MNNEERDELLIRIDERVRDIKEDDIPEIKGGLKDHSKRIRRVEIIIAGLVALTGGVTGLIKLLG